MFIFCLLIIFLSAVATYPTVPDPYNCGYALTRHNSSAYAGLYAWNRCEAIFYNETIHDYQDAYAYSMYGGCECKFFATMRSCTFDLDEPVFRGPTAENGEVGFEDPKPKWYRCGRSS